MNRRCTLASLAVAVAADELVRIDFPEAEETMQADNQAI
jgi:hypothetical protein